MTMTKSIKKDEPKTAPEKKYKYREVYKAQKNARKKDGWEETTEEEKSRHGCRKYIGSVLSLMRKEVA